MKRRRQSISFAFFMILSLVPYAISHAQTDSLRRKSGTISFITIQNAYVQFADTKGIAAGDTVFSVFANGPLPIMVVKYLSSQSCAGPIIGKPSLKVGEHVYVLARVEEPGPSTAEVSPAAQKPVPVAETARDETRPVVRFNSEHSPRYYGGISANSYSNFSNFASSPKIQRWNYSLNFNGDNVLGSPVSFSSYMNYSYLGSQWKGIRGSPLSNLRVYDLAAQYKGTTFRMWAGRHINRELSGVGPIDGLQFEEQFGAYKLGEVVGSRPDFYTLGYNPNLFQVGGYLTRTDTTASGLLQSTLGLFQQNNGMSTDRRFIYLQHTSSPTSYLNLYMSAQVDLFKISAGIPQSSFSLTDFYFSSLYSPVSLFSVDFSYNTQRNTIYYQTFGSTLDSLLLSQNQLRHNFRLGFYLHPSFRTQISLGAGYSFQEGDLSPTRNATVSLTQSDIPLIGISATLSYDRTFSGFLQGYTYGINLYKWLPFNSSNISAGYMHVDYKTGSLGILQNQSNVTFSTRFFGGLFLNFFYQGTFSGSTTYTSVMGGFSYRF